MRNLIEAIRIHEKMKSCREILKSLYASEYDDKVKLWIAYINGVKNTNPDLNTLQAVLWMKDNFPNLQDNAIGIMWLMAAAYDILDKEN